MAVDDVTRRKIIRLYNKGMKTADITRETGVGRSSIYFILQQEGVAPVRAPRDGHSTKGRDEEVKQLIEENRQLKRENATLRQRIAELMSRLDSIIEKAANWTM